MHPDAAIREQAEAAQVEAHRLLTDLSLDREVYDLLVVDDAEQRTSGLDDDAERVRNFALRDFRRSGVDRDEATSATGSAPSTSARPSSARPSSATSATTTPRSRLRPEQLAGLPQDWVDSHPVGDDGLVELTLEYPDVVPMLTVRHRPRRPRRRRHRRSTTARWPANDEVLVELMALRREHATLLGYDGWPAYDAEVKMIETGDAIDDVHRQDQQGGRGVGAPRPRHPPRARIRQDRPDAEVLDAADSTSTSRSITPRAARRGRPGGAPLLRLREGPAGAARRDRSAVRPGLRRAVDVPDLARRRRVVRRVARRRARSAGSTSTCTRAPNKFNHAAQFTLTDGVTGRQLPEGVLVCNFPRGLMEHGDVVTLFHEFGHLVHHVLGGHQRWARFAGVATEWDFVEAPSQLLEEWAWDAGVLEGFATDEDGQPIPADLVARMREAEDFAQGAAGAHPDVLRRAVLPVPPGPARRRRRRSPRCRATLQATYSMVTPLPDTHFHAAFGHLDGYSSGYYTYMWSLVIAKDLFSAFDRDNLYDAEIAAPLPRPDPGPGRAQGRRGPGRGLPRPAVRLRVVRRPGSRSEAARASRVGTPASVDRLVDDRAEAVDDLEVAGQVGLGAVAAPPDAGVEHLGGAADDGVGLDAGVGDDVDVVLVVVDAVGVGAVEAAELHPDLVTGVGEVEPDVVGERGELAPRRAAAVHHVEHLVDAVGGEVGRERRDRVGGQLGVAAVDQRLVRLAAVG